MKKIFLDDKEVAEVVPESLPMLIHGVHGSGASLYTVCLAAKWFLQDYPILFLCGYSMAEESFAQEIGSEHLNAKFYTQEKVNEFIHAVKDIKDPKTIVVIKNIELFGSEVFKTVNGIKNIIFSGDVNKTAFADELLAKDFTTEVYFSPLRGKDVPRLEKFHGFVTAGDYKGITYLK